MKRMLRNKFLERALSVYLVAVIVFTSLPLSVFGTETEEVDFDIHLTVNDVKEVTINPTETFTISLTTTGATACELVSPASSGVSLSTTMNIEPGHPWYPVEGGSTLFSVICYDALDNTITDSAIVYASVPIDPDPEDPIPTLTPTADIKVNDSDGPVTINNGDPYIYSWDSTNATACTLTSPTGESGISLSGTGAPIEPSHPWYPSTSTPVTLTLNCTNAGPETAVDSVVVKLKDPIVPPPPPPPVKNTCPAPSSLGDTTIETIGVSYGNETSLQDILNNSGYSINVISDQKQYQVWQVSSGTKVVVNPTKFIAGITAHPSVFGYYTNGSMESFVPVFKLADIEGFESVPRASAGDVVINIEGATSIGFAIKSFNGNWVSQGDFATENALNPGSGDQVLVYNPSANKYILAFEDLVAGDFDYQDMVVEISFDCEELIPAPTADIKVNDSDGPVTINNGDPYIYSWDSTNATACTLTSPTGESGISLSGTGAPIEPSHPWYPSTSTPVTLTLNCTNAGPETAVDSVVVKLKDPIVPPPPTPKAILNVKSSGASSVVIERVSGPSDIGGTTDYTRSYNEEINAVIKAPTTSGSNTFVSWSGCDSVSGEGDRTCAIGVDVGVTKTVTANYKAPSNGGPSPICPLPEITSSLTASVTVNQAFSYTIVATTTTATTTTFAIDESDLPDGLTFATSTGIISGTPTKTGTFNINIRAQNDCGIDNEVLVIQVNPTTPPPGGGGGGGGGSSSGGSSRPPITVTECFYLRDYMRRDFNNDPMEVLKLQAFLINFEGHTNVSLTGVFDQATFDAVSAFQMKYFTDILEPWGHTGPTGYVYILTLKKINEIYCQRLFPLNEAQINEIIAFRALLESLRARGVDIQLPPSFIDPTDPGENGSTTTPTDLVPIVGEADDDQGQNLGFLASVIFAQPESALEIAKCLYQWLLTIFVLYIIGNVLKNVLYKDIPQNARKRFLTQWLTMDIGLIVAIALAYWLGWWCLILPLLIAFIISMLWTLTYPKHNSIRASIKSWYLVVMARGKSFFRRNPPALKAPVVTVGKKASPEDEKIEEDNRVIPLGGETKKK